MFHHSSFTRNIVLFLLFCLLASLPTLSVLANHRAESLPQNVTFSLQPNSQTVVVGQTFSVQIMAASVENLGSFEFDLRYDSTLLQFNQATLGEFPTSTGRNFTPTGPNNDPNQGVVKYGAFSLGTTPNGPSGQGILATLTFTALAEGSSNLDFIAAQVTNISGTEQQIAQMTNAQVTITSTQATATPTQIAVSTSTPTPTQIAASTSTPTPTSDTSFLYLPMIVKN